MGIENGTPGQNGAPRENGDGKSGESTTRRVGNRIAQIVLTLSQLIPGGTAQAAEKTSPEKKPVPAAEAELDAKAPPRMAKTKERGPDGKLTEKLVPAAQLELNHAEQNTTKPPRELNKITRWEDGALEYTGQPSIPAPPAVLKGAYLLTEKGEGTEKGVEYLVYGKNKLKVTDGLPSMEEIQTAESTTGELLAAYRYKEKYYFVLAGKGKIAKDGGRLMPAYSLPETKLSTFIAPGREIMWYTPGQSPRERAQAKKDAEAGAVAPMPPPMAPMPAEGEKPMPEAAKNALNNKEESKIQKLERDVQKLGLLTIDHSAPETIREKMINTKSYTRPIGFKVLKLTQGAEFVPDGECYIQHSVPRNFGDQIHVATTPRALFVNGKKVEHPSSIQYSHGPNGGFKNPILYSTVNGNGKDTYIASHDTIFIQPIYPEENNAQVAQRIGPVATEKLKEPIKIAAAIPYNVANSDPTKVGVLGGNCLAKARISEIAGGPDFGSIEGFNPTHHTRHTTNFARVETPDHEKVLVSYDVRNTGESVVGDDDTIITGALDERMQGMNNGLYGALATDATGKQLVGEMQYGVEEVPMESLDPALKKYITALCKENDKKYDAPKVAVAGGGK